MKPSMRKTGSALGILMVMILLLAVGKGSSASAFDESGTAGQDAVKIEITAPSELERTIAPGRHFKVAGSLSGEVPDDAVLSVTLLDATGSERRYAAAERKGTERVVPLIYKGSITVFVPDAEFSELAYTAPELAVADPEDPQASVHDATVKCVFTDETFYALIVSATDPEHGLAEADGYELDDPEGRPYDALPEGTYTVQVKLSSVDGRELASASREIEIGRTAGTIIHEITTPTAFQKGGKDLLYAWAAKENLKILEDLLPGFFGTEYPMATMPMAVSCETAEYLPGGIRMLVYGNTVISASFALEVAKYLQLEHNVENPDIASYYAFSLGEPRFAGEQDEIVEFADDENMRICRIDHVEDGTQDGVFLTTEEQVLGSDTDPSDGWILEEGTFAVAGVMKPYQLQDDELVPDRDIYGFYHFLNGADTLVYTFTTIDGSETFSMTKTAGVSRIDESD